MELPLFPLHTVLCPGVALPLHIFEERYRRMVDRCVDAGEPFGVVLIREGRETGPLDGRISRIGTTAIIRDAGRYPDGRFDLMTVGGRRFRIETLTDSQEPYLIADVRYLREPIGDPDMARKLAERVSARFLRYLAVLQPALEDDDDGSDYEVEVIVDDDPEDIGVSGSAATSMPGGEGRSDRHAAGDPEGRGGRGEGRDSGDDAPPDRVIAGTEADRRELLMAAARRLVVPEDPTAISYVLSGLIQVELPSRQRLLEAATTELRLRRLEGLLGREIDLLNRDLKPLVIDARGAAGRLN
ncbi:MAG TPA: LON peptidase substrate-binding domain-containing protein [Candidatus Limnocylindrales bacterium]|jgi:Lon protease-like protein